MNYVDNSWPYNNVTGNVSQGGDILGSWCYDNNPSNCDIDGRLYTWDAAIVACPAGWCLPSRDDWGALAIAASGTNIYGVSGPAGTALKFQSDWDSGDDGTDAFGFSALPGGRRTPDGGRFLGYDSWWTATENGSGSAYHRTMTSYCSNVGGNGDYYKDFGLSVRCLRN